MTERWEPFPGGAPIGFSIDLEPRCETVSIIPTGELDVATVGQLQSQLEELIEGGFVRMVIDLRGVEFIDSTGLPALLSAHERARREDWQLAIVPGRHAVQRLFEMTGTIEQLPFTAATSASSPDALNSPLPHRPYDIELAPWAPGQPRADPILHTHPTAR